MIFNLNQYQFKNIIDACGEIKLLIFYSVVILITIMNTSDRERERREKILKQRKDELRRLLLQQHFEKSSRLIVNFLVNKPDTILSNGKLNLNFFRDNYPNCTEEEVCVAEFLVKTEEARSDKIKAQKALAKQANAERRLLPRQDEIDCHRNLIAHLNQQQIGIVNTLVRCFEILRKIAHYDPFHPRFQQEWTLINERFKLTSPERVLTMNDDVSDEFVKVRQEISVSAKQLFEQLKAIEAQCNIQLNAQRIIRTRQSIALSQAVIQFQLQSSLVQQACTGLERFQSKRLKTD